MKFKSIMQSILAATFLSASCYAAAEGQILCPSSQLIQQSWQTLNTVSVMSDNKFTVWSLDGIKDAGTSWHITTYATAHDLNTALVIGQQNVKGITDQKNKAAMDMGDILLCGYNSSGDPMGVTAISFKSENENFKIASFNLKALNLGSH